jgi:cellulose synthase/poly-beta-1,6-N-acetylglucosamine synthase-like glycosyltransferase
MASAPLQASVIVPVYNGVATLPALLTAMRGQNLAGLGEVEFLFVDNNSTDGSGALIEGFGLPNARVLKEPVQGVSAARNRALAEARGVVLAALDADCVPTRQWLREIVVPFADPGLVIAAGGLASYPPRTAAQRFVARYGMNEAGRNTKMGLGFANGRNMAVRRSAAAAVGGWRVDMTRGEDMDFSYRVMTRYNCSVEYLPRAMAFHQDRADDESLLQQAFGYGQGLAMMYARHPELLPWGVTQRARRARSTLRRRVGALRQKVAQRLGRATPDDAEFAIYLDMWNSEYWRGFDTERRAMKAAR